MMHSEPRRIRQKTTGTRVRWLLCALPQVHSCTDLVPHEQMRRSCATCTLRGGGAAAAEAPVI